ncbi:hypothetical protein CWI75_15000 [Kineobactrum sediminis]|uniref:AAA+ ATPase domain-containing protein n=1 Tax=Kineobactrum sediminis TaxID=1905677 RepID=A0A2N5XZG8_9GAMM|nr:AAA family ATPase [Kineobactrum sediminis]PLW81538.1 hypothetical protein CWI75_15000 [Kineobactrum sediminis]
MYDQFYHFKSEPFRLSPDHAFAYAHKGFNKARAYMSYAFNRAEGFVMITGRPGTGKTTLIGALVDDLAGKDVSVAHLVCTQLQADDLLKMVAYEFGVSVNVVEKGELLQRLTQQFRSWHRDGRRALLIVDEAQDLSVSAMEELRLLTNIQVSGKPLLQIFLLGQPELRELVLSPALEQVHQRIVAASHMQALAMEETQAYIMHRLEVVGWRGDPAISQAVFPLVYKFSEGIPRRINLICSRLLLHCAVEERHRIGVADVQEVVRELQGESLAAGASFAAADFAVDDVPNPDTDHGTGNDSAPAASAEPAVAQPPARTPAPPVTPQKPNPRTQQRQRLKVVANGAAGAGALHADDFTPPGFDTNGYAAGEDDSDEEAAEEIIIETAGAAMAQPQDAPTRPQAAPGKSRKARPADAEAGATPTSRSPAPEPANHSRPAPAQHTRNGSPRVAPATRAVDAAPDTTFDKSRGRRSFTDSWMILAVFGASVALVIWGANGFSLAFFTQ